MKPQALSYSDLPQLRQAHPELIEHDHIELALSELFDIAFPQKKDSKTDIEVQAYANDVTAGKPNEWGLWVYYPWLNQVVHLPPVQELRALRTSRNRNLITSEEQATLYQSTIVIVGMSVGSNIVEALISQGIGGKLILIDMDIIEPSNLNRIRSPYHHVGLHKVDAVARKVWEIDPYLDIIGYYDGLNAENLQTIIADHTPDVIIDEMDELRMKIKLREAAKEHSLPVIMAADDGDDALVDIERYDLHPDAPLFSGRISEEILDHIRQQELSRPELGMLIGRYFVGPENVPLRMYQSLSEVGKTLPSWPQLGGAAALSGISLAYIVKKILLGKDINDGRILMSLDEKFDREHLAEAYQQELAAYQAHMKGN